MNTDNTFEQELNCSDYMDSLYIFDDYDSVEQNLYEEEQNTYSETDICFE